MQLLQKISRKPATIVFVVQIRVKSIHISMEAEKGQNKLRIQKQVTKFQKQIKKIKKQVNDSKNKLKIQKQIKDSKTN